MKKSLPLLLVLICAPAIGQVYKCVEGERVTYSQTPCGDVAKRLDIKEAPRQLFGFEKDQHRRRSYLKANPGLPPHIEGAILGGVATLGMTEAQVVAAMGDPVDRHLTQTKHSSRWPWVFERSSGRRSYVYLEDGRVVGSN